MSDGQLVCCGLDIEFWPIVKDHVARAFRYNADRMDINDIEEAIKDKRMQLWAIHDGVIKCVIVTQIVSYDKCNAVRVVTVTGDNYEQWLEMGCDTIAAWGQAHGCTLMEMMGRRGWEKPLMRLGFKEPQILMTKYI
jgi:hypothetical protein